ncbi:hypothetical protein HYU07_06915 [Candidatus Woesearchaeota archaeon]|nr:hypothetical protein [Candidatus Woesearchaeota archaeon]
MAEGGDTQEIDRLLNLTKDVASFESKFFNAKNLQERVEATTDIQESIEQEKNLGTKYECKSLDLFINLNAAEKEFLEAKTRDEKSEAKGKLDGYVQQIQELKQNYRFECPELKKFIDGKKKFQRALTSEINDNIKKRLDELAMWLAKFPHYKEELSELDKGLSKIGIAIDSYDKKLKQQYKRTLMAIGVVFGLAVITLSLYFYFRGTNIMKDVDTAQTKTKEYETRVTAQIKEARKSLDLKIAEANVPVLKRIDEIYEIASVLDERVARIEADYSILNTIKKNIQDLQTDMAADREKYAPILPKLSKIEESSDIVMKNKVDEKEYQKERGELIKLISSLREDVDKLRGKNYGP